MEPPALVRFVERLGEERLRGFATQDFLVLDALARDVKLSEPLRARLPALVNVGVVEAIGRGRDARYILSRALHDAIGSCGAYTRRRGLDRETNKALLLKHVRDSAEDGARMEEVQQVLPALSRHQILLFLTQLRQDGAVYFGGQRRGTRWFPGTPSDTG